MAGLLGVRELGCDCVVSIDADLQQDQWAIESFVEKYAEGYDIVSGIRNGRDTDGFLQKIYGIIFLQIDELAWSKNPG